MMRIFFNSVLLSTARPTSPASDQTKGSGQSGVQENAEVRCRERKVRSDEDTAPSKLSPEEYAKKIRES